MSTLETAPSLVQNCFPSARILLIEDNTINRLLLRDYLSHLGYDVFTLEGGSEFLPTIDRFQPHLILLDLKLPDVDGYTLLEQLRHSQDWSHIPVVVVSAYAFSSNQQRAISLGARRYLVKPVDLNVLSAAVAEELTHSSM